MIHQLLPPRLAGPLKLLWRAQSASPGRRLLPLALLLCLLTLTGCGLGTRYVFSSTSEIVATPDQAGLAYEEIWFASPDGVNLHGWYIPGDPNQPLVLFFHGNAANITHRIEIILCLHRLGLPIFIFDYRGYGASEGRAVREEDLYQDARGALQWLRTRGWPPERLIFHGRSLGAAVALQVALEQPPAGLVVEGAFTSLPGIAWKTTPVIFTLLGWWSIDARFDNLSKIAALQRPLLVIHGREDQVVPWSMGRKLYEKAPEPKKFLSVPGAGHSDACEAGSDLYQSAWRSFLLQLEPL